MHSAVSASDTQMRRFYHSLNLLKPFFPFFPFLTSAIFRWCNCFLTTFPNSAILSRLSFQSNPPANQHKQTVLHIKGIVCIWFAVSVYSYAHSFAHCWQSQCLCLPYTWAYSIWIITFVILFEQLTVSICL